MQISNDELANVIINNKTNLYRLAYSIVGNDQDAQDAVGDTIIKAFENIAKIRKPESLKSWLFQILVNSSKSIKKKASRELTNYDSLNSEEASIFGFDEMWELVNELPLEQREVIVLYYYEGFSVKEICKMLDIAEGTVKSRLSRSREKLLSMLEE